MYAQHNPSLIHICSAFDTQIILTHCQHISEVYPTLISCVYQIMLYIYIICALLRKGCVWVCLRMWYQKKKLYAFYTLKLPFDHLGVYTIFRHIHIVFDTDMHLAAIWQELNI